MWKPLRSHSVFVQNQPLFIHKNYPYIFVSTYTDTTVILKSEKSFLKEPEMTMIT